MDIRETVLRFLYENKGYADLVKILEPFDDNRLAISQLLLELEKEGNIKIDQDFRKMIGKSEGKYRPLSKVKVLAKLTDQGRLYFERIYLKADDKPTVKIEVKGDRANLHIGDNYGEYNQSNQESTKSQSQEIKIPVKTPLKNTIIKFILSIIAGIAVALIVWKITGKV